MPNVIVEPEDGTFAAIQNKRVIVRGKTQLEAAVKAHDLRPNDHVVAARVHGTPPPGRDKLSTCLDQSEGETVISANATSRARHSGAVCA